MSRKTATAPAPENAASETPAPAPENAASETPAPAPENAASETPAPAPENPASEPPAPAPLNDSGSAPWGVYQAFFDDLAQRIESDPVGAQGSIVFQEPIPLPFEMHLFDGVWRVPMARWQFQIENDLIVSAVRRDQTHLWKRGAQKIEAPEPAA